LQPNIDAEVFSKRELSWNVEVNLWIKSIFGWDVGGTVVGLYVPLIFTADVRFLKVPILPAVALQLVSTFCGNTEPFIFDLTAPL
jgi:hypothetical protein